jgi:bile acid:Na+ symporter, BASS family
MKLFSHLLSLINHRNFLLSFALILGLILGDNTWILPQISVYVLAVVMVFATVDFSFGIFKKPLLSLKILGWTFTLNYLIFGGIILLISRYLFPGNELWIGCVLLAASPPGPSVVPFTAIMKGDISTGVIGLFGLHLLALIAAPLIFVLFTGSSIIDPAVILIILAKTVVAPIIVSRPLRHPKVLPVIQKVKGKVINWGFFLIIVPIVGQSTHVMSMNPQLIWQSILLFLITMFLSAFLFNIISLKLKVDRAKIIAYSFFLTTKSSAFAAVVVFAMEDKVAGIPAAVHAFFVTLFFLAYSSLKTYLTPAPNMK